MNKPLFLTGATGNIGTELVRQLKERGTAFIAGVPQRELPALSRHGIGGVALDFDDRDSLERAFRDMDRLFMLLPLHEKMIEWGENIVAAAHDAGIRFIVRSSLLDAAPDSPYALFRVHGIVDQLLRDSGIPHAIVHPNSFMQNFVVYYRDDIADRSRFFLAQGDAGVSYADVADIAAAAAEILVAPEGHSGREYDVTGPQALTGDDAAGILSAVTGREIEYVALSPEDYEERLAKEGSSQWHINMMLSLERHIRDGKSARVSPDLEELVGRKPGDFMQFARQNKDSWERTVATVYD